MGTEKLSSSLGNDSARVPANARTAAFAGEVKNSDRIKAEMKKPDEPSRLFSLLCGSLVCPRWTPIRVEIESLTESISTATIAAVFGNTMKVKPTETINIIAP